MRDRGDGTDAASSYLLIRCLGLKYVEAPVKGRKQPVVRPDVLDAIDAPVRRVAASLPGAAVRAARMHTKVEVRPEAGQRGHLSSRVWLERSSAGEKGNGAKTQSLCMHHVPGIHIVYTVVQLYCRYKRKAENHNKIQLNRAAPPRGDRTIIECGGVPTYWQCQMLVAVRLHWIFGPNINYI